MKKQNFLSLLIFLLFITSCDTNTTVNQEQNELWSLENQILENGKQLDIEPYNESIQKALSVRMPWAYSPLNIAMKIAGQQMNSQEYNLVSRSLTGSKLITEVVVLIEKKQLADKGGVSEYLWIHLKLGGSIWQISEIKQAWACESNLKLKGEGCQ